MSRLDKFKNVADALLQNIVMTERDREAVRQKLAERTARPKLPRRRRAAYSFGALAVTAALMFLVVLPLIPANAPPPGGDSSGVAANLGNSDNFTVYSDRETPADAFGVFASAETPAGIAPDSGFYIDVPDGGVSAEILADMIAIEPAVSFSLTPASENRYLMTLSQPLENGEVVTVSIKKDGGAPLSWAFQTETSLSVASTIPADGSNGMPLETGIEINFSRIISGGAEDYIKISPEIPGRFLYYGKTVVFAPSADLAADTIYTVTVLPGLTADSGEVCEEPYTFSFRTPVSQNNPYAFFSNYDSFTETFIPGDTVALRVSASDNFKNAAVEIYSLGSAGEYLALAGEHEERIHPYLGKDSDAVLPTDGYALSEAFVTDIAELENGSWYRPQYILLPDLAEGWYLVNMTVEGDTGSAVTIQKLVQVSPLSVYCEAYDGEAVVWLNSSVTGQSISGAAVEFKLDGRTFSAATDRRGIAYIEYDGTSGQKAELLISMGGAVFAEIVPVDLNGIASERGYYSYVYLDRPVYLPDDTVNYWGIIIPRDGNALPPSLDLSVSTYTAQPRKIDEISLGAGGVFSGSFTLEGHVSGGVTLSFTSGGQDVASTSFTVSEYKKPVYTLSVSTDRDYYRRGETINAEVGAQFYDGSTASGIEVTLHDNNESHRFTLDAAGTAETEIVPYLYSSDWTPTYQYLNAYSSGAEDVYSYASAGALYFPSDYMLTTKASDSGGDFTAEIESNAIDFARFDEYADGNYYAHLEEFRGAAADVSGVVTITRCYYESVPSGSYYDFINKVTVDTYENVYHEDLVFTEHFSTSQGKYSTSPYSPPDDDIGSYYRMDVSYTSPDGVALTTSLTFTGGNYYFSDFYYVTADNSNENGFRLGQEIDFRLEGRGEITAGSTLYTIYTDVLASCHAVSLDDFTIQYSETLIPTAVVYAAYFDGRHIYQASPYYLHYDYTERELDIEIITDADSYAPGDTALVSVRVTDSEGRPVSAEFAAGVVDEALFAISEQYTDPLSSLYGWQYTPYPMRYTSFVDKDSFIGGAEGGGGDGVDIREEFEDTAAFVTGETTTNGWAEFEFVLPDNLTSWRITVNAVTVTGEGATAKKNIAVTLPFFLSLVANDRYNAGDDVSLSARVYGVSDGENVDYSVTFGGETVTASGSAGEFTFINLGKFQPGSYPLTVTAKSAGFSDGITREVRVLESLHEIRMVSRGILSEPVAIDAVRYPVVMVFYDAGRELYMSALSKLLQISGARSDQALAAGVALELMGNYCGFLGEPDSSGLTAYQDYLGGVRLFAYGDADPETTALTLAAAPSLINADLAVSYLYSVIADRMSTSGEVAAAYFGLAAAREPVLSDVRVLAASPDGFEDSDMLLLACALAALGDRGGAAEIYDSQILPRVGEIDDWVYIEAGDFDDDYSATVSAAILAVYLGVPETDGFIRYLAENTGSESLPVYPLALYLSGYTPAPGGASFSCVYEGRETVFDLGEKGAQALQFNRGELESANFKTLSGSVGYLAVYTGNPDTSGADSADGIKLHVSSADSLSVGERVEVTAQVSFDEGIPGHIYTLDLLLPSGMRFVGMPAYGDNKYAGVYLVSRELNRLTFVLDRGYYLAGTSMLTGSFTVTFYACAVLPGEFVFESPVLSGMDTSLTSLGNSGSVTIK